MINLLNPAELDREMALTIAAGMHAMANIDQDFDHRERAVIDDFLRELNISGETPSIDLNQLDNPQSQEIFLRSLAVVALSDGSIKSEEVALLQSYIDQLGLEITAQSVIHDVGREMLSHFRGVSLFRNQAEAIGQALGLTESDIAAALN